MVIGIGSVVRERQVPSGAGIRSHGPPYPKRHAGVWLLLLPAALGGSGRGVRLVEGGHDVGGNSAAVGQSPTVVSGPLADGLGLVTIGGRAGGPARGGGAGLSG